MNVHQQTLLKIITEKNNVFSKEWICFVYYLHDVC